MSDFNTFQQSYKKFYNQFLAEGFDHDQARNMAIDAATQETGYDPSQGSKKTRKTTRDYEQKTDNEINKRIDRLQVEQQHSEDVLEIEREILELLGKRNRDLEHKGVLLQDELATQKAILEEELDRKEIDEERIKKQQEIIAEIHKQIELNEQLNKSREYGNSLGETFAGSIGIATTGFSALVSEADGFGNKLNVMKNAVIGIGQGLSKSFSGANVVSSLGTMALESLNALDKLNDQLFVTTGMQNMGAIAGEVASSLDSISLRGPEVGSAISAMQVEFKGFYDIAEATQKEILGTAAVLQQFGVSAQDTAQATGFMVTALGATPAAAEETSRELVTLAQKLGIPPAEIVSGFNAAQKSLSKFGPNMKSEFKKMAAASAALNMNVGRLIDTMGTMDTFEGAATMAGNLNAILGGPLLNSMELLGQNESERLITLKQTLDQTGKNFDMMSKFERISIAKAMGMDIDELAKFMRKDADQIRAAMEEAEVKAKTQKQLEDERLKAMSIMSRLVIEIEKAMQEAFGGEDGIFKKENLVEIKDTISSFFGVMKKIGEIFGKIHSIWKDTFGAGDLTAIVGTIGTIGAGIGLVKGAGGMLIDKILGRGGPGKGSPGGPPGGGTKSLISSLAGRAKDSFTAFKEGGVGSAIKTAVMGSEPSPGEGITASQAGTDAMHVYIAGFSGEFADLYKQIIDALQSGGGPGGGGDEGGLLESLEDFAPDGDGKKKRKRTRKQKLRAKERSTRRGRRARARRARELRRLRAGGKAKGGRLRSIASGIANKFTRGKAAAGTAMGMSVGRKAASKTAAKTAGKFAAKRIPGAGLVLGMSDAVSYLRQGKVVSGVLEGAGAIASSVPLVGTALSIGLGAAALAFTDVGSSIKEIGKGAANLIEDVTGLNLTRGGIAKKPSQDPKYSNVRSQWESLNARGKEMYCDEQGRPPYGTNPNGCSEVWIARRKRKQAERIKTPPPGEYNATNLPVVGNINKAARMNRANTTGITSVDDARIKLNVSDQIDITGIASKPGGLLASKLDELINLIKQGSGGRGTTPVVLQIDGRELGRATINSVNKLYSTSLE